MIPLKKSTPWTKNKQKKYIGHPPAIFIYYVYAHVYFLIPHLVKYTFKFFSDFTETQEKEKYRSAMRFSGIQVRPEGFHVLIIKVCTYI